MLERELVQKMVANTRTLRPGSKEGYKSGWFGGSLEVINPSKGRRRTEEAIGKYHSFDGDGEASPSFQHWPLTSKRHTILVEEPRPKKNGKAPHSHSLRCAAGSLGGQTCAERSGVG